jgi:hypothetical protein
MAAAHSLTAGQILDQLWAVRERELLHRVASGRELDYESLLSDFGNSFAQSGMKLEVQMEKSEKKKSRKSSVPEEERCKARVWNGGKGGQCTRRGCKGPGNDLCGNHARCLADKGDLPQGRIDGEVPENMLSSGDSSPKSDLEEKVGENVDVLSGGVNEHDLDAALQVLAGEEEIVVPEELSSSPVGKKKRGRPKGSKKKSDDDTNSVDTVGELEEIELQAEVSQADIISALHSYFDGGDLKTIGLSSAKKAIHSKLGIIKTDYDSKWFKKQFEEMKSAAEKAAKAIEMQKLEEAEKSEDIQVVEEDEVHDSDDDSEEVACKELTVDEIVYLLDPETLKVYARDSPNGFIGKYDGNSINFDAVDSDDED